MNKLINFKSYLMMMLCLFVISCSSDDEVVDINSIPVAQNLTMTVEDGAATEMEFVATDADYDALTFSIVDSPSLGTITINGNKGTYTVSYTHLTLPTNREV